jgi:hypothetical protein
MSESAVRLTTEQLRSLAAEAFERAGASEPVAALLARTMRTPTVTASPATALRVCRASALNSRRDGSTARPYLK